MPAKESEFGQLSGGSKKPSFWKGIQEKAIENIGVAIAGLIATAMIAGATTTWAVIKNWVVVDLPAGLVISSIRECRDLAGGGWSAFDPAGGRFIVGAGGHPSNPGVTKSYAAFTSEGAAPQTGMMQSTGGSEAFQIPGIDPPTVEFDAPDGYLRNNNPNYRAVTNVRLSGGGKGPSDVSGIPPYVALYYCIKI